MKIMLNGKDHEVQGETTIAALLGELKFTCGGIAVAVNGEIVARDAQSTQLINDGDRVEIIRAIGGG